MGLGATSQQFLREVETLTGLPVEVEIDERLQAPLLARFQMARGAVPFHRVSYHPSAGAMADYLIAYQCSFALRLYALPASERFDLADSAAAVSDSLAWAKAFPTCASLPLDRQETFAAFVRTSLMSMIRSIPVGLWIDRELRRLHPGLREPQEQAIRRQIDTHASLFRPEIRRNIPEAPFQMNLAINAAFAKFWGKELGQSAWTLPYLAVGALVRGEALLQRSDALPPMPGNDRRLIQAWAEELGLGTWIQWVPYVP